MQVLITLRKLWWILLLVLLAILLMVLAFFISTGGKASKTPAAPTESILTPAPTVINFGSNTILQVTPSQDLQLIPGSQLIIRISFTGQINLTSFQITPTKQSVTADTPVSSVPISTRQDTENRISIVVNEPVTANTAYTIRIIDRRDTANALNLKYVSQPLLPTKVQVNNPQLKEFLPYETNTFRLSYLEDRNVYVFNFKYDPSNPDDLQTQFETAQAQATQFIQSKGIDINSIVIEWRHS